MFYNIVLSLCLSFGLLGLSVETHSLIIGQDVGIFETVVVA